METSPSSTEEDSDYQTYVREIGGLLVEDPKSDKTLEERIWESPQTD
jgi:hypothetical protein